MLNGIRVEGIVVDLYSHDQQFVTSVDFNGEAGLSEARSYAESRGEVIFSGFVLSREPSTMTMSHTFVPAGFESRVNGHDIRDAIMGSRAYQIFIVVMPEVIDGEAIEEPKQLEPARKSLPKKGSTRKRKI